MSFNIDILIIIIPIITIIFSFFMLSFSIISKINGNFKSFSELFTIFIKGIIIPRLKTSKIDIKTENIEKISRIIFSFL